MKSSVPESAQCRSSNTSATSPVSAMRSKKVRQAANSCSELAVSVPMPSSASSAGSIQRRSPSSGTCSMTVSAIRARVVASSSSAARPARRRTISPSAQNVIPSPYDGRTAGVPPDRLEDAVDVLQELPAQPALPDAGRRPSRSPGGPASRGRWRGTAPSAAESRRRGRRRAPRAHPIAPALLVPPRPGWRARRGSVRTSPSYPVRRRTRTRSPRLRRAWWARRRAPSPGSATDWSRDAVLTRSPATMPWFVAPSVTAASPVRMPARAWIPGPSREPRRPGRGLPARCARRRPPARSELPTRP